MTSAEKKLWSRIVALEAEVEMLWLIVEKLMKWTGMRDGTERASASDGKSGE